MDIHPIKFLNYCENGNVDKVGVISELFPKIVNVKDQSGRHGLLISAIRGNLALFDLLMTQKHIDVDLRKVVNKKVGTLVCSPKIEVSYWSGPDTGHLKLYH